MNRKEKRDSRRIDLFASLRGEVSVFQALAVQEISRRGMRVETRFALQVDTLHDFRLTLEDRSIVVRGRVAHSRITKVDQDVVVYVTGVEFSELSGPAASAINDFVELMRLADLKFPNHKGKG